LDVGLPSNARGATEPLACYFLRLFADGVFGTPGTPGAPGDAGPAGRNAYTFVTHDFTQPALNNPQLIIRTVFNIAIQPGMHIFIPTSGWYHVDAVTPDGSIFVTLLQATIAPEPIIRSGCLVLPSGAQGVATPGAKGQPGAKGAKGDQGNKGLPGNPGLPGLPAPVSGVTNNNGQYHTDVGTDHKNPNTGPAWTPVDFTVSLANVTLTTPGVYLLNVCTMLKTADSGTSFELRLYDITTALAVAGALEFTKSTSPRCLSMSAILTTTNANEVIRLEAFGKNGTVYADNTTITFVQLA
jgi:hypothetical protein